MATDFTAGYAARLLESRIAGLIKNRIIFGYRFGFSCQTPRSDLVGGRAAVN